MIQQKESHRFFILLAIHIKHSVETIVLTKCNNDAFGVIDNSFGVI